jgi:hypothetical protein
MHQKTCFKCNITKPIDEFYKHKMMADGHLGKCKDCTKQDEKNRFAEKGKDPIWMEKELARQREKSARFRAEGRFPNKEASDRAKKAWYQRNKHKKYANGCVKYAIQSGKLIRQPCEVCGELRVQAHHDDYSKPLDVKWLCTKHHAERHVELNRLNRKYE